MKEIDGELVQLNNYDLSKIQKDFEIPYYERKAYSRHIHEIANAIMEGKLINNVITVAKKGKKLILLDGLQRLNALSYLFSEGKLKKYDIVVKVVPMEMNGALAESYRDLNKGKQLTANDLTRSYDNGKIPVFNSLDQFASHYGSQHKLTFWEILAAYIYVSSENVHVSRQEINEDLLNIPQDDIHRMKSFLTEMFIYFGSNVASIGFKIVVFRNLMKLYFEDHRLEKKLIDEVKSTKTFANLANDRTVEGFEQMYNFMRKFQQK